MALVAAGLVALWIAGAFAFLARWERRRRRFASVVASGRRLTIGRETDAVERVRLRLALVRMTDVVVSSDIAEPGVWGVIHPVVVLPNGLADRLSDEEL